MTNKIQVSQNSGTVTFGNVVQGNRNQTGNLISHAAIDSALRSACDQIQRLAARPEDAELVVAQMQELAEEAKRPTPDASKGSSIIKIIRDNSSWAYPVIKDLLSAVWPALLALV